MNMYKVFFVLWLLIGVHNIISWDGTLSRMNRFYYTLLLIAALLCMAKLGGWY